MKKMIINNFAALIVFLLVAAIGVALVVLCCLSSADLPTKVMMFVIEGVPAIILIVYMLFFIAELIIVYDDKIVSIKIYKRTVIFYANIVRIVEKSKDSLDGTGSLIDVWEIIDNNNQSICLMKTKGRDTIIELINDLTIKNKQ